MHTAPQKVSQTGQDEQTDYKDTNQRHDQPNPAAALATLRPRRRDQRRRCAVNRWHVVIHRCENLSHASDRGKCPLCIEFLASRWIMACSSFVQIVHLDSKRFGSNVTLFREPLLRRWR